MHIYLYSTFILQKFATKSFQINFQMSSVPSYAINQTSIIHQRNGERSRTSIRDEDGNVFVVKSLLKGTSWSVNEVLPTVHNMIAMTNYPQPSEKTPTKTSTCT